MPTAATWRREVCILCGAVLIAEFWSISISGNLAQACLNRVSLGELNLKFVMVDLSPSLVLKIRNMKCRLCQSWNAKVVIALNIA